MAEPALRRGDARRALGERARAGRARRPPPARRHRAATSRCPWFWSDQYDRKIQLAGRSGPDDEVEVVDGSIEERRFVALYGRAGKLVGVLGMNRPRPVMQFRRLIADSASWDEALKEADS